MSAEHFLDTNVLVYSVDGGVPEKQQQARRLIAESLTSGNGCISYQVVQETVNVLIGKIGMPIDMVRPFVDEVLIPLWQVHPTGSLYYSAMSLHGRYGFSFYDSLIVAAAIEAGCTRLYSEDMQHGQQIQRLTILNPFVPATGVVPP